MRPTPDGMFGRLSDVINIAKPEEWSLKRRAAGVADQLGVGLRPDCSVGDGNNRRLSVKVTFHLLPSQRCYRLDAR